MTYLNRTAEKRAHPELVLPGVRSVITVTQSYFTGWLPPEVRNDPARGLIAAYAWGQDYHDIILPRLEELADYLKSITPGTATRCFTDSGPVLEREFGERAGLGFIGKNTMLIHPRRGSLFFIGEILTTLELPPSPLPVLPGCGSCTRCLQACPTHALPAPYILDSNLCISYLTIEYKGIIPRPLRSKLGNHIFGCDDCQDCCPWNERFSTPTSEPAYASTLDRQAPLLAELAALSESDFRNKFAKSPVLRPKYEGFLRNVAIALGNWNDEAALDSLELLLSHESALVRLHAAWAVGQIKTPRAFAMLSRRLPIETDENVLSEIRESIP